MEEQTALERGHEPERQVMMEPEEEPLILEDVVIETLAIDGICGVY